MLISEHRYLCATAQIFLSLVLWFIGTKGIRKELKESQCTQADNAIIVWGIITVVALITVNICCFYYGSSFKFHDPLMLIFVFMCSVFIGIVDYYTHDMYIETIPLLLSFILIGMYYQGVKFAAVGLLTGVLISLLIICLEFLITRKISYGGGDVIFGILGNALVGYAHTELYWIAIGILSSLTAIFVVIRRKLFKKFTKEDIFAGNLPLLPIFALVTCVIFALSVIEARSGVTWISDFCFHYCKVW